ncbi:MAG: tryptophan--tRNA ligase [Bacilli bacterium]|jgi:tryptophanyl-tRNA synthetase|nr:tryptophan--tRNA ligase [Bacilli bacterium]MDY0063683.1 tryptophan--tRNA ligase [Bacilli bacterium]
MKFVLSGVKPTGIPTLGNYLGALKNFVRLQNEMKEFEFLIFVADLHAITTPQDPQELKEHTRSVAALYLASGLDLDNLTLFIQSEVHEHVELGYVMQSLAYMGELERMTQYKDKMQKQVQGVTSALFTYPALMAADILLYDASYVPVGDDQIQHLELTRNLATRFNNRYHDFFTVPEPLTVKVGSRIMDLQSPTNKMDKSAENPKGCISLLDSIPTIKKKIKAAVTDNEAKVYFDSEKKPGISNLMTIYSSITGDSLQAITALYEGKGYGDFKNDLAEIVAKEIEQVQTKYFEWIHSPMLDEILDEGKARASMFARSKLQKLYSLMGIGR